MDLFTVSSLVAWLLVVILTGLVRGRVLFMGVVLGIYTLLAVVLLPPVTTLLVYIYIYAHATVYISFALLARPRMVIFPFRVLLTWPAYWFLGSTLLAFPWAIISCFSSSPVFGQWIPYTIAALGFIDIFFPRRQTVQIVIGEAAPPSLSRWKSEEGSDPFPIRIVQITDPHLGPFMSVEGLKHICEHAVAVNPDLVLLTGDFLTMESRSNHALLVTALAPLRALEGRCFACLGNHDYEEPEHVYDGLASAGVKLLVDAIAEVETAGGRVEVLGLDFRWRDRQTHLEGVSAHFPRKEGLPRIALLHDPGAFRHLPPGTADLVLSGHTHGGQIGLFWIGLPYTIVSALTRMPDHGLWSRGKDRLYVHRGTGHYGFPLRIGVPPEQSVIELHRSY